MILGQFIWGILLGPAFCPRTQLASWALSGTGGGRCSGLSRQGLDRLCQGKSLHKRQNPRERLLGASLLIPASLTSVSPVVSLSL